MSICRVEECQTYQLQEGKLLPIKDKPQSIPDRPKDDKVDSEDGKVNSKTKWESQLNCM